MPRSILLELAFGRDFLARCLCHTPTEPTNGKPAPFFVADIYYDRYNDPKKYTSDHNLTEKKKGGVKLSVLFARAVKIRGLKN